MKKQSFKYITIWTNDEHPDVLFSAYASKLEITLDIAHELIRSRLEFCDGKPMYVLIDFTNVKSVTKEARDYMNSPDGGLKGVLGGAFLSANVVATLFINLFLKVSPPVVPAKFFTNRVDALVWLQKIRIEKLEFA
ncbi:MAG: hypothetical protein HC859_08705 [Bacteroidia bacterium]|nr:hypothetical protein [Bacteroidia bacterium]